jgi:hypothetical protein
MFALLVDGDLLASGMHGGDGVDGLAAFRRRAARRLRCITTPYNHLQISTEIFIFDQGW